MLPETILKCFTVVGKMAQLSFAAFKTAIATQTMMYHVTKHCNVIGPHWRDKAVQ